MFLVVLFDSMTDELRGRHIKSLCRFFDVLMVFFSDPQTDSLLQQTYFTKMLNNILKYKVYGKFKTANSPKSYTIKMIFFHKKKVNRCSNMISTFFQHFNYVSFS